MTKHIITGKLYEIVVNSLKKNCWFCYDKIDKYEKIKNNIAEYSIALGHDTHNTKKQSLLNMIDLAFI